MRGLFLVLAVLVHIPAFAQDIARDLANCDETLEQTPKHPTAYRCYWIVARRHAAWDAAVSHVERLLAIDPKQHRVRLSLALLVGDLGDWDRSLPLLRDVVQSFARVRDAQGEIYARHTLAYLLVNHGEFDEAETLLRDGERVANASGDAMLQVAIYVEQAYLAHRRGDFGWAWNRYRDAERRLIDERPSAAYLRSRIMTGLASAANASARYRDAMEIFQERAELLRAMNNPFDESFARLDAAWMAERLWREGELPRGEVELLSRNALDLAERAENLRAAGEARLLQATFLPADVRKAELERALSYGLYWGERAYLSRVYRTLARHARDHPGNGRAHAERALEAARESGDPVELAASLVELAEVESADSEGLSGQAIDAWDRAIEAIENVRSLQPDDSVRARFLADWSFVYYRVTSLLLDRYRVTKEPKLLEQAFVISERRRSRVLLDRLDAARATPGFRGDDALTSRRDDVLSRIVSVQTELLANELSKRERVALLEKLDDFERTERALRDQLARLDPETASIRAPAFPSLLEVESSLSDDEAILSFHVPGASGPDGELPQSWLQVTTREGTTVFPLPARRVIDPAIDFFLGLVKRRDGTDELGARRLYELLIAGALERLPTTIDRLLVVPDGKLHGLPFAALHDGDAPIIVRFEISIVPSITAAMRWRARRDRRPSGGALVFADPTTPARSVERPIESERSWALATAGTLGALPHARVEGMAVRSLVGGNSRLLEGDEATESSLKSADLAVYSVLHFAAHGILDEANPQRSAILLAAGDGGEDGLLQLRDIAELDASGKLVVLSACRSASGELVRGEGILGFGRAFFQAGAQAVIGGLWSLDDREASVAFESFYRHLHGDTSVAAALRDAQLELLDFGVDTAGWAGIVLLGDAELVPRTPGRSMQLPLVSVLFILAVASLIAIQRYRRAGA